MATQTRKLIFHQPDPSLLGIRRRLESLRDDLAGEFGPLRSWQQQSVLQRLGNAIDDLKTHEERQAAEVQVPKLLRPAEAAELLGINRTTIYEWIASKRLPSYRNGRAVRVPVAALRQLIEAQTEPATGTGTR